jgi:hypothetical protein
LNLFGLFARLFANLLGFDEVGLLSMGVLLLGLPSRRNSLASCTCYPESFLPFVLPFEVPKKRGKTMPSELGELTYVVQAGSGTRRNVCLSVFEVPIWWRPPSE